MEQIRRRAKYRLVGASVLVLVGVVAFPLLFDHQPRPIPVDTIIDIPDRGKVSPLTLEPELKLPKATAPATPPVAPGSEPLAQAAAPGPVAQPAPTAPAPRTVAQVAAQPIITETAEPPRAPPIMDKKLATAAHPTAAASAPTARSATADGARAAALLSGQPAATPANTPAKDAANSSGRYVVQVGAFADTHRANEVRTKLEAAKLKTYTHVADTKDGKRTRVRLGPFDTRAEADKAAARVKKLNLPAAVLVL